MQFIDLKTQYTRIETPVLEGINKVLKHGQYIMGPEIQALEAELATFVGAKHAIVNSSGTDALLMSLLALDIQPGDEVITSAFSFFATAEVIALINAVPVFVDIDPNTYNLDPKKLAAAITPKTKAIMPVSLYGQCADMNAINAIAEPNGIPVIEDAAQSFGAFYHGKRSCNLSTIGCTSFFPSKPLGGYGDSGACFTNDDKIAEALRQVRIHGQVGRYIHHRIGINGRMDSIQAAVLLEKLKIFPDEIDARQKIAHRYDEWLAGHVKTPKISHGYTSVYAQYTIEVEHRAEFVAQMNHRNIPTAIHYPSAMFEQEAMKPYVHNSVADCPHSLGAGQHVVSLPMHPYLSIKDQETIAKAVIASQQAISAEV